MEEIPRPSLSASRPALCLDTANSRRAVRDRRAEHAWMTFISNSIYLMRHKLSRSVCAEVGGGGCGVLYMAAVFAGALARSSCAASRRVKISE